MLLELASNIFDFAILRPLCLVELICEVFEYSTTCRFYLEWLNLVDGLNPILSFNDLLNFSKQSLF